MTDTGLTPTCRDCAVRMGDTHLDGCDVARCLRSGGQRLSCPGWSTGFHDCGQETWTGLWPGVAECRSLGWFSYWQPPARGQQHGRFIRCPQGYPDAREDLNRLYSEGHWNPDAARWEPGACAHRYAEHIVHAPDYSPQPQLLLECGECGQLLNGSLLAAIGVPVPAADESH